MLGGLITTKRLTSIGCTFTMFGSKWLGLGRVTYHGTAFVSWLFYFCRKTHVLMEYRQR